MLGGESATVLHGDIRTYLGTYYRYFETHQDRQRTCVVCRANLLLSALFNGSVPQFVPEVVIIHCSARFTRSVPAVAYLPFSFADVTAPL